MLQAGIDLNAGAPCEPSRVAKPRKELEAYPIIPRRSTCVSGYIDQAGVYLLVAQFPQAEAQLDAAERMLKLVEKHPRNVAGLKNARAAVLIEKMTLAMEDEPMSAEILSNLNAAEKNLIQAQSLLDVAGGDGGLLGATVDFQRALVHELRGRALEVRQKKNEALDEFKAGMKACDKALATRNRTLPANNVVVLETRTLHSWLNLRLGDAKAAQKRLESLKPHDETHQKKRHRSRPLSARATGSRKQTRPHGGRGRLREQASPPCRRRPEQSGRRVVATGANSVLPQVGSSPARSLRLNIEHKDDPELAKYAVEWLINGKTRLTDVLAAQVQTAKAAGAEYSKFQKSVQRQAYLLYGEPTSSPVSLQDEFLHEEILKREFVEEASKKFPLHLRWYTLPEVCKSLAPDEVYVGVYSLRPQETAARHYYAWIVDRQGTVQTIDLRDADRIDSLVKTFQREQEKVPFLAPGQERKAEQDLRDKCLTELSERVLQPIRKRVNGQKRWVVSPDGPLWNVPWSALLLETDRYAIEELTFRYAISGQDLVRERRTAPSVGAPLVLGDPWFNYPDNNPLRLRKQGLDPLRIPWDRLEYSKRECDVVFAVLQDNKLQPTRYSSVMRKEQLFDLQSAPSVVYLSTHAFAPLPSRVAVHDPLLSCALAFAGWNYPPPDRDALPGMMTGAELLGVDLRGTELVVLASCEAGTEPLVAGQSPANLRHAFHLAGARSVVSALWPIQDRSSLELMEPFGERQLPPGQGAGVAGGTAAIDALSADVSRSHASVYWAGFTISAARCNHR